MPAPSTPTDTAWKLAPEVINTQEEIVEEIAARHRRAGEERREALAARQGALAPGTPVPHLGATLLDHPPYRSSLLRHPTKNPRLVDPETIERHSPAFGHRDVASIESDLTIQHVGEPLGERMIVTGRVLDGDGRPVPRQLVELWQANSAGRYIHQRDQHPAPLDPNFTGAGRCLTDDEGWYRFTTIKPGAYPWKNHRNAWRPAHIHFSVFGTAFTQRLVTQMYFPGDPLFALDPIYQSIPDQRDRDGLVAQYDHDVTESEWAIGYRWDMVLTGPRATWTEDEESEA